MLSAWKPAFKKCVVTYVKMSLFKSLPICLCFADSYWFIWVASEISVHTFHRMQIKNWNIHSVFILILFVVRVRF